MGKVSIDVNSKMTHCSSKWDLTDAAAVRETVDCISPFTKLKAGAQHLKKSLKFGKINTCKKNTLKVDNIYSEMYYGTAFKSKWFSSMDYFLIFTYLRLGYIDRRDRELPFAGLVPKWLKWAGLSHGNAINLELCLGLPSEYWGSGPCTIVHCFPGCLRRELDWKEQSALLSVVNKLTSRGWAKAVSGMVITLWTLTTEHAISDSQEYPCPWAQQDNWATTESNVKASLTQSPLTVQAPHAA